MSFSHQPVLLAEVLDALHPEDGGFFIDATLGLGGHSEALLQASAALKLVGIDQDPEALVRSTERLQTFADRATLVAGNFGDIDELAHQHHWPLAQGILMDIGVSSMQLDDPERGFSFSQNGPLDMRMDPENTVSAATIVNTWPEVQLARLLFQYGEERLSRKIARVIVQRRKKRPFWETSDLAAIVSEQYPPAARFKHPHPATRVFQALRIEVNRELEVLERAIPLAIELLAPGGRLAVISFHSLEDRVVKLLFREAEASGQGTVLTKRPVTATEAEMAENPRSRSAKLRVFSRI